MSTSQSTKALVLHRKACLQYPYLKQFGINNNNKDVYNLPNYKVLCTDTKESTPTK